MLCFTKDLREFAKETESISLIYTENRSKGKKKRLDRAPHCYLAPAVQREAQDSATHLRFPGYEGKAHLAALINLFGDQRATSQCHSYRNALHLFLHDPTSAPSLLRVKKKEKDAL